jgi:hypothetical protein
MHVARRGFVAFTLVVSSIAGLAPLQAQGHRGEGRGIPPGHMPPAGMCRIWIDGVPPGRQSAPMDCAIAVRRAPRHARVIYGPGARYYVVKDGKRHKHHKHHHDRRWDDRREPRHERVIIVPERRRVESTTVCISHDRTGVCVRQGR